MSDDARIEVLEAKLKVARTALDSIGRALDGVIVTIRFTSIRPMPIQNALTILTHMRKRVGEILEDLQ